MHIHPPHKVGSNIKDHFVHFLMLFLAVLLGALAENYRENYIERNKEHEYLNSLISDLRQDTSRLKICIESRIEKNTNAKKLISLLSQPVISNTKDIYYLTRLMTRVEAFEGVDGTFNQLRSGGFSLIEDQKIITKVNEYLHIRKTVYDYNTTEENILLQLRNSLSQVVKAEIFSQMLNSEMNKNYKYYIKPLEKNEELFSNDKTKINNLVYWISSDNGNQTLNKNQMLLLKNKAIELIKLIESQMN